MRVAQLSLARHPCGQLVLSADHGTDRLLPDPVAGYGKWCVSDVNHQSNRDTNYRNCDLEY